MSDGAKKVRQCTACGREFAPGKAPDEWQCACGGLVRKTAPKHSVPKGFPMGLNVPRWRARLLALWTEGEGTNLPGISSDEFSAWSGATKDVLLGLGLEWSEEKGDYVFVDDCGDCGGTADGYDGVTIHHDEDCPLR